MENTPSQVQTDEFKDALLNVASTSERIARLKAQRISFEKQSNLELNRLRMAVAHLSLAWSSHLLTTMDLPSELAMTTPQLSASQIEIEARIQEVNREEVEHEIQASEENQVQGNEEVEEEEQEPDEINEEEESVEQPPEEEDTLEEEIPAEVEEEDQEESTPQETQEKESEPEAEEENRKPGPVKIVTFDNDSMESYLEGMQSGRLSDFEPF